MALSASAGMVGSTSPAATRIPIPVPELGDSVEEEPGIKPFMDEGEAVAVGPYGACSCVLSPGRKDACPLDVAAEPGFAPGMSRPQRPQYSSAARAGALQWGHHTDVQSVAVDDEAGSASTYVWDIDSRVHGLSRFPLWSASQSEAQC